MSWKSELEKLLRDQMPYAFMADDGHVRGQVMEEHFSDALGYITEFVLMKMKASYFEGYAKGGEDTTFDINKELESPSGEEGCPQVGKFVHDASLSRTGAEKAWLKWDGKE